MLPKLQKFGLNFWRQTLVWFSALSIRERGLVLAAIGVAAFIGVYTLSEMTVTAFAEQSLELSRVDSKRRDLIYQITRYKTLAAKKRDIEGQFSKVASGEDTLSRLETLVQTKAKIQQGAFKIDDSLKPRDFGDTYQLVPYLVKFSTTDYGGLTDLLQELVLGERPFILSELDLRKGESGRLDIVAQLNSIRTNQQTLTE